METELYRKGQARVDEANKQALSGQVGGALTKEGIISQNGVSPITSTTLTSTPEVKLPTTQPTSSIADGVIASTMASADQFQKEAERVIAEQNKGQQAIQQERETTMGKIKGLFGQKSDLLDQRAEAEKQIDPFRTELANINKEIADQNVALRGETDAIMARGDVSREGQQSLLQNVKDTYGRRLADLAIRQSAANQNVTALETALERKLELATASIKNDIEYYKEFELANLDNLEDDEKQRVKDIIAEKERQMESVTKRETAIAGVLKTALDNGVKLPDNVISKMQKAGSELELYQILSDNNISLAKTSDKIPTIKTINGVDMQWNPATQAWDSIGSSVANKQSSIDQLIFLRKTIAEANDLSDSAGASGLGRKLGDWFVGDTDYRRLEAKTNTLRTNVLTLMTDPSVKKYFGPQMSEADVRLMTAAGTTLNPENNSPEDLKAELVRLDDLLNRMETSVRTGAGSESDVITAPDGQLIQFID